LKGMTQTACCEAKDRHIPGFLLDNFLRRLLFPPKKKVSKFISRGFAVADIGCGPGHFTIPIAQIVGAAGKVYAADSDPKSIQALKTKTEVENLQDIIEARTTSAANLEFVPNQSVDFAFANGLICCMTDHAGAVAEIKRILKPHGRAYISVTKALRSADSRAVTKEEWKRILDSFKVQESAERLTNRWAIVSVNGSLAREH
jgi:ubiquinone/menaquinone biosynthesis C-methylase UbiE